MRTTKTQANKEMDRIMDDHRASKKWIEDTGDTTTAHGRRCVNIVLNVNYLLDQYLNVLKISDTIDEVLERGRFL